MVMAMIERAVMAFERENCEKFENLLGRATRKISVGKNHVLVY